MVELIQQYGDAFSLVGAQAYETARAGAGITTPFTTPLADAPTQDQIAETISWAVHQTVKDTQGQAQAPDFETIAKRLEGATKKLVYQPERQTIIQAVAADPKASRWAREPEGADTCHFCSLLCTRGAVYVSKGTADFRAHDGCDCLAVPVFAGQKYVPPEHVQQWDDLYVKATSGVHGMKAKQRAWRQAFEASKAEQQANQTTGE